MFGSLPFWIGAIYVCFPLGLLLYGWNDLGDVDTDRQNPRKDSWLCKVPQLNGPAMVFCAMFAMQSHLFGQLMDYDQDRQAGRRSTVLCIGVLPGKFLLVAIMLAETWIAWNWFQGQTAAWVMLAGSVFFLGDAIAGPARYPDWFFRAFFLAWNVAVLATMHFVWRYGVFLA